MKYAVITGASSGIGAEFARQLRASGEADAFILIARRRERLAELCEELCTTTHIVTADLATMEGLDAVKSALSEIKPDIKYFISAAGFGSFGTYSELTEEEVGGMIDVNVRASVLLTHAAIPYMKEGARIIELGSGSCFTPLPAFNTYAASKSFILHYSKGLRFELKPKGISVTCFCPGWVQTEFLGKATDTRGRTQPKRMSPMLRCDKVVHGCIRAARRSRAMYVTNWYTKLQHLLFKIVPDSVLSRLWLGMLEKK